MFLSIKADSVIFFVSRSIVIDQKKKKVINFIERVEFALKANLFDEQISNRTQNFGRESPFRVNSLEIGR